MDEFKCPRCESQGVPRRIRSDATGTYLICDSCGTGTKLGPADKLTDETTDETIVGVREHMPRGAADS